MAALTQEVLQAIAQSVAMALQQAGVQQARQVPLENKKKTATDTKAIRIRDFDGDQTNWEEWMHSF